MHTQSHPRGNTHTKNKEYMGSVTAIVIFLLWTVIDILVDWNKSHEKKDFLSQDEQIYFFFRWNHDIWECHSYVTLFMLLVPFSGMLHVANSCSSHGLQLIESECWSSSGRKAKEKLSYHLLICFQNLGTCWMLYHLWISLHLGLETVFSSSVYGKNKLELKTKSTKEADFVGFEGYFRKCWKGFTRETESPSQLE